MTRTTPQRVFSTTVNILLAITMAACVRRDDPARTPADRSFKVALLTTGPVADEAWNAGAYRGLIAIRDSLGARISNVQTRTPAEIEDNFRQYATSGYNLVFGHGFEYQDPAIRVAHDFPRTTFVVTSGARTAPNVAAIDFDFANGAYVAGIVAGARTRSNVIGMIGGTELPPVAEAFRAFAAGARSANPKVRVLTSYVGNWEDVSAAREQALAQIARGADVVFQNADAAGLGVFQAARESRGIRVIGSNSDQAGVAPDIVLGSVVIDLPRAFLMIAREVKNGTFRPGIIRLGEHERVVRWAPNPRLASEIPPATRALVDSAEQRIRAGTLDVEHQVAR